MKKKGKKRKEKGSPIFRFDLLARVFVDPLLRARLRARLLHARENAPVRARAPRSAVFSLSLLALPFAHPPFPVSFFLPFSLSISLAGPRGRQEAVTARIVTHKLLSIVGVVTRAILAPMLLHSSRTRAAFSRGDNLAGGRVCVIIVPIFFPFFLSLSFFSFKSP